MLAKVVNQPTDSPEERGGACQGNPHLAPLAARRTNRRLLLCRRYHHTHPHAYLQGRHPHGVPAPHTMARAMSGLPGLSHPMQHFAPPPPPPPAPPSAAAAQAPGPPTWPGDPFRDPYRYDPLQQLRYNPLMAAAAYRAQEEEERAKLYAAGYPAPPSAVAGLRAKDPSPGPLSNLHMHHRAGPGPGAPGPMSGGQAQTMLHNAAELHKKEDASQSR
jgi:hypothetical protein